MDIFDFYKGKRVLITGHTGFKGSWLCYILKKMGAIVTGYALDCSSSESLYNIARIDEDMQSVIGDIRDFEKLQRTFKENEPEIVFHLAAQPIVRESYLNPRYTYETNVMGTVNVCECIRISKFVKSFVNVTTDKVYKNREWEWGYRENEMLDGYDPYSNSKSCSELVTHSYINSFFKDMPVAVSTARAGNVIGGGDFATDRIIPDCIRAMKLNKTIQVRNPQSIRPYQHVLEPLYIYLLIAMKQYETKQYSGFYNVGPDDMDCISTGELVSLFCEIWGGAAKWQAQCVEGPHEANFLKLDCSRLKTKFDWKPKWHISTAVEKTIEWTKVYYNGENIKICMDQQIEEFFNKYR